MQVYDTLHLWLPIERAGVKNLLTHSKPYLKNITEHIMQDRQTYITGLLGTNYRVTVSVTGISLKGSISKHFKNDNYCTLSRVESQKAIEKLGDELHLPIEQAKVSRIDFAQNLTMQYSPETYYNYLGDCRYYNRLTQPQSLYYRNTLRTKLFYNKVAESRKKGLLVPAILQGANLLRYETRFISRLPKQFNRPEITANDLHDEIFYEGLVNRWEQEYKAINKINSINFNHTIMKSPKDVFKQMILKQLHDIGPANAMQLVEDLRAKGTFKKAEYYSRLKRDIKNLLKEPGLTTKCDLVDELDKKITEVKQSSK